jgi:hypothetical protein
MKVAIYHDSVPNRKNQEKLDCLQFMSEGIRRAGDQTVDVVGDVLVDSEVGMIQGWTSGWSEKRHLQLRNKVINRLTHDHCLTADSNLFLYADGGNTAHYLRYSFDGIFPDTGIYFDRDVDPARWQRLSERLQIGLQDWRQSGSHILLLLQRNGGWSMGGLGVVEWATAVVQELRRHTDRPIKVRCHPGDRSAMVYIADLQHLGVGLTDPLEDLRVDLLDCWAAVNYNSSPVVGAAISGVPIFVTDPVHSQSAEVANTDLSLIETPAMPDRQAWVERLAMSHWNFDELRSGEAWAHMRQYV